MLNIASSSGRCCLNLSSYSERSAVKTQPDGHTKNHCWNRWIGRAWIFQISAFVLCETCQTPYSDSHEISTLDSPYIFQFYRVSNNFAKLRNAQVFFFNRRLAINQSRDKRARATRRLARSIKNKLHTFSTRVSTKEKKIQIIKKKFNWVISFVIE